MKDIKKTPSWSKYIAARDAFVRATGSKSKASAKEKQVAKDAYAKASAQCIQEANQPWIQEANQPKAPKLKTPSPPRAGLR